jgi:hypothetical protein
LPGIDLQTVVTQAQAQHALFLSSPDGGAVVGSAVSQIVSHLPPTFPIVVFGPMVHKLTLPNNVIPITGPNRTVALLRLMWALGQTKDKRRLRKLLIAD